LTAAWLEKLAAGMEGQSVLNEICGLVGYDYDRRRTLPESPLVVASEDKLSTIAAAVLYRHGVPWAVAEARADEALAETASAMPVDGLVRGAGDVEALMDRLTDAGVRLAVVTIDDRARTESVLRALGVAHRVDTLVCGEAGLPWKPEPDMLLTACGRLETDPARTVVVGDTLADMQITRAGGAGLAVAVLSAMGDSAQLAECSDVVLGSIDEITIVQGQ
jgi:phosphoglycolate phosphatase-like HAD superfamily hydrolase